MIVITAQPYAQPGETVKFSAIVVQVHPEPAYAQNTQLSIWVGTDNAAGISYGMGTVQYIPLNLTQGASYSYNGSFVMQARVMPIMVQFGWPPNAGGTWDGAEIYVQPWPAGPNPLSGDNLINSIIKGATPFSLKVPSLSAITPPDVLSKVIEGNLPVITPPDLPALQLTTKQLKDVVLGGVQKILSGPGNLPGDLFDFCFLRAPGSPDSTVWAALTFPKAFSSTPTVIVTPEYRDGWFDPLTMEAPSIAVVEQKLEDFRSKLQDVEFTPPSITGEFPTAEEIKADMDARLAGMKMDVTSLADAIKQQATTALTNKFGDWKVGPFNINGIRDAVIAGLIAVVIIAAVLTAPAAFAAMIVVVGLLAASIIKMVFDLQKKQQEALNALHTAQTNLTNAVQKYTNDLTAGVQKYAYDLSSQNLAAINAFAKVHTDQAAAALNNAPALLYGMSDLPQMKLPVCAVRNVTTTGCEVLIPKGGTVNIFVVGYSASPSPVGKWPQLPKFPPG